MTAMLPCGLGNAVLLCFILPLAIRCESAFELPDSEDIKNELSPELQEEEAHEPRFFAAVIDAGSTGTRLHLFEFKHSIAWDASAPFELVRETFKEMKPGLSSFADDPKEAAISVRALVSHAKSVIPRRLVPHTPIILQATAGLRLLPGNQADEILRYVKAEIELSGLLIGDDAVGILSGSDEGIFGWFTLNFLTGRLNFMGDSGPEGTAVALDLGGGSTQISFNLRNRKQLHEDRIHHVSIFDRNFELYTHSYLGNGLIAARLSIASLLGDEKSTLLTTHCLPPGVKIDNWSYAGRIFQISASEEASFEKCLEQTSAFVQENSNVAAIPHLDDVPVFGFGYFFDRGMQAGLVRNEPKTRGGWAQLKEFKLAAQQACQIRPEEMGPEHWRPWMCLDLTYIYSLLSRGYGLSDDKSIHLSKKMREMEVSWALGAGFHLLNSYHHHHFANVSRNGTLSTRIFTNIVSYISDRATDVLGYFNLISA